MNLNDKQKTEYIIEIRKKIAKSLIYILLFPFLFLFALMIFTFLGILCSPLNILTNLCKNDFLKGLENDYINLIDFCFKEPFELIEELTGEF